MKKRTNGIFGGAVALAACSVLAKAISGLTRLPLTSVIGGEGMGAYQLISSAYALFFTLACGGLPSAAARVTAREGDSPRLRAAILSFSSVAGLGFAVIFCALSPLIAVVQGDRSSVAAYLAIAPAVAFSTVFGGVRGYFQGKGNLLPTSLGGLVEQGVKLVCGLFFAAKFSPFGATAGAAGALLGTTISEVAACAFVFAVFLIERRPKAVRLASAEAADVAAVSSPIPVSETVCADESAGIATGGEYVAAGEDFSAEAADDKSETTRLVREIIKAALPVAISSLSLPLVSAAEGFAAVRMLAAQGVGLAEATARYGLSSGTARSLLSVAGTVPAAIAATLLPRVSGAKDDEEANGEILFALKLSLCFAAFCATAGVLFAREAAAVLYPTLPPAQSELLASSVRFESVAAAFSAVSVVATAALHGKGRYGYAVFCSALGGAVRLATSLVVVLSAGAVGSAIGACAGTAAAACASFFGLRLRVGRAGYGGVRAIFVVAVSGLAARLVSSFFAVEIIRAAAGIAVGGAAWLALLPLPFAKVERERLRFFKL